MYRVRSTDVWYNAPGVVAAYQPIAAPDPFAARQNVRNDGRTAGAYMTRDGNAPAWHGAIGWRFTAGSSHYLTVGIIPKIGWSVLIQYSGAAANTFILGGQSQRYAITPLTASGSTGYNYFNNTDSYFASGTAAGNVGMSGNIAYRHGVAIGTPLTYVGALTREVYVGALNTGAVTAPYTGNIQALAMWSRTLSPAEMRLASRQMAYCHVNPDWSAWGRRRQYYYAPSEAVAVAGNVGIYGRRGSVALPGGVRIEAVR